MKKPPRKKKMSTARNPPSRKRKKYVSAFYPTDRRLAMYLKGREYSWPIKIQSIANDLTPLRTFNLFGL